MDDAYLTLVIRENGPSGVLRGHTDRPAVALLLGAIARVFGRHFWTFAFAASALLWTILGIQTCALWRMMLPGWSRFALVAGLIAVSPIVVQTQLCTATVSLFGGLSVVVAFWALFVLRDAIRRNDRTRFTLGLGLGFISVLFTEYAVAAACTAAVLLANADPDCDRAKRRQYIRGALALIGVVVLAYCAFLLVSDLGERPEVDPRRRLKSLEPLKSFPFSLVSRAWQVIVGSYGSAFGHVWVEADSASTIVAATVGALVAAAVLLLTRPTRNEADPREPTSSPIRVLLLSVIAGIVPVAAMRPYSPHPFATRFNLPVLPAAVVLTLGAVFWLIRSRYRGFAVALFTFVAGTTAFADSWQGIRQQRRMREIGRQVREQLAPSGITSVVVSSTALCEAPDWCTGQATAGWPVDLEKRVWVFDPEEGMKAFGSRLGGRPTPALKVDVRTVSRVGPVSRVLWVQQVGDSFRVEPYFEAPQGP